MASIKQSKLKKAQGFEAWFFVVVALLAFSLFFVVLNKVWGDVKQPLEDGLSGAMPSNGVNISTTLGQVTSAGLQFDKLIPLLIIGLFGFIMISAGAIIRHPIMIFVGILILGVVILISVVFSNLYNDITSSDEFSDTKADMPIQDLFMHYLPIIVSVMAVVIFISVLLSRAGGGQL